MKGALAFRVTMSRLEGLWYIAQERVESHRASISRLGVLSIMSGSGESSRLPMQTASRSGSQQHGLWDGREFHDSCLPCHELREVVLRYDTNHDWLMCGQKWGRPQQHGEGCGAELLMWASLPFTHTPEGHQAFKQT